MKKKNVILFLLQIQQQKPINQVKTQHTKTEEKINNTKPHQQKDRNRQLR